MELIWADLTKHCISKQYWVSDGIQKETERFIIHLESDSESESDDEEILQYYCIFSNFRTFILWFHFTPFSDSINFDS